MDMFDISQSLYFCCKKNGHDQFDYQIQGFRYIVKQNPDISRVNHLFLYDYYLGYNTTL